MAGVAALSKIERQSPVVDDSDFPPIEIKRLAQSSGKPLEVTTAAALIASGWTATLGSYFVDGDDRRELDVLALKEMAIAVNNEDVRLRIRALISCKGFRPTCAPMTYSVSRSDPSTVRPRLLFDARLPTQKTRTEGSNLIEVTGTSSLLKFAQLTDARRIVAFDIVEREERPPKAGGPPKPPVFKSIGDRVLYEGLDSALKATFYWRERDPQSPTCLVTIYIPVLVLGQRFFDIAIDGGVAADPEVRQRGYQSCLYPIDRGADPISVMTLVWSADALPDLVLALETFFGAFTFKLQQALGLKI